MDLLGATRSRRCRNDRLLRFRRDLPEPGARSIGNPDRADGRPAHDSMAYDMTYDMIHDMILI